MEMAGWPLASYFTLVGGASSKWTILEGSDHKEEVETRTHQTLTLRAKPSTPTGALLPPRVWTNNW